MTRRCSSRIESFPELRELSFRDLGAAGPKRYPDALATMKTVSVKGTLASVKGRSRPPLSHTGSTSYEMILQ